MLWPEAKVPMIGYEEVGQQANGMKLLGLDQYALEGGAVRLLVKHRLSRHRAIEGVMGQPAGGVAAKPGHDELE